MKTVKVSYLKWILFLVFATAWLTSGLGAKILGNFFGDRDGEISDPVLKVVFGLILTSPLVISIVYIAYLRFHKSIEYDSLKDYAYILGIITIVFIISSNIAWLNPRPNFREKKGEYLKLSEKIPWMWQYNLDSHTELFSATFFPSYFREVPTRINRPGYPFIVHCLSYLVAITSRPFLSLSFIERGVTSYILLKWIVYLLSAILMYELVKEQSNRNCAISTVGLTFFKSFSLVVMGTYHTYELQFLTPVIILFLFGNLSRSYSLKKNVLFSLVVGFLMLAKQNYAVYMAVLGYALLHLKVREVLISVVVHLLPLFLWLVVLSLVGIEYYNHEVQEYSQGVWLYKTFIHQNIILMLQTILTSIRSFLVALVDYYSVWIFIAVFMIGAHRLAHLGPLGSEVVTLFFLFVATTWFQAIAANRYNN